MNIKYFTLPFALTMFAFLLSLLMQYLQESYYCRNQGVCIAWGAFWLFFVLNIFILLTTLIVIKIISNKNHILLFSLSFILISYLVGVYFSWKTYTIATNRYLRINNTQTDFEIPWENIKGMNVYWWYQRKRSVPNTCEKSITLDLSGGNYYDLQVYNLNLLRYSVSEYLFFKKNISIKDYGDPRCIKYSVPRYPEL